MNIKKMLCLSYFETRISNQYNNMKTDYKINLKLPKRKKDDKSPQKIIYSQLRLMKRIKTALKRYYLLLLQQIVIYYINPK